MSTSSDSNSLSVADSNGALNEIHHVVIAVGNVSKAVEWYTKHFHCDHFRCDQFRCDIEYHDETRALFVFGNTRLALVPPKQHPPHIGFIHPQAESFGELKLHRDGTRSCYVADPAGNAVEVLALIGTS
jgi:catechol 2,3-dioxygenase-like lactoylglutathione lyase family enzyme